MTMNPTDNLESVLEPGDAPDRRVARLHGT